ncbi:MAG: hypothetical protein KIT58_11940 [Planctomycetota bacterium]|nr:hypothetical protein [Planctomycetota bacterium]
MPRLLERQVEELRVEPALAASPALAAAGASAARTSGGRCSKPIGPSPARTAARAIAFSSCLTFPGHG